jgi:Large polyvalent protein-associated domain 3
MNDLRQHIEKARKQSRNWAFKYLAGTTVINSTTKIPIFISKSGLKHTIGLYRTNKEFELEALTNIHILPELLESAEFVQTETDKTNNNLTQVYRFRAMYTRNGETFTVGIILKEQKLNDEVKVFYDHHIINRT